MVGMYVREGMGWEMETGTGVTLEGWLASRPEGREQDGVGRDEGVGDFIFCVLFGRGRDLEIGWGWGWGRGGGWAGDREGLLTLGIREDG